VGSKALCEKKRLSFSNMQRKKMATGKQ